MNHYKLIIETVTPQTAHDWADNGVDGGTWTTVFDPNLGKFMIVEMWMTGDETVGDCQTLMEDNDKPIFWDSVEDAIDYITHEYHSSTKAVQEVMLDKDSIYKVKLGGADIASTWKEQFSTLQPNSGNYEINHSH